MHAVTGATGHIGVNLVRALAATGQPVRALHRGPLPEVLADLEIESAHLDLLDPGTIAPALEGARVVTHLAGLISIDGDPDGMAYRVNVEGSRLVAEAALAAGVARFVQVSSLHAFDVFDPKGTTDETNPRARSDAPAYDRSKADGDEAVRAVIDRGLSAVFVHPSGVCGPVDHRPSRLGQGLLDLRDGKVPALIEGRIDVVDVRDVVQGILGAIEHGRTGESYILGGHGVSIRELMGAAAEVCGVRVPGFVCPMWMARLSAPLAMVWAMMTGSDPMVTSEALRALRANPHVSHAKAAHELGYDPRPLEATLEDLYASFTELGL